MRLTLSSDAAPHFELQELVESGLKRGFSGVELVSGQAHGVGASGGVGISSRARETLEARDAGLPILGLYLPQGSRPDAHSAAALSARCSAVPSATRSMSSPGVSASAA